MGSRASLMAVCLAVVACGGDGAAARRAQPPVRGDTIFQDGGFTIRDDAPSTSPPTSDPAGCRRTIATADTASNRSELGGYFYSFVDREGTRIWPVAGSDGGVFEMSPGGAEATRGAARIFGRLGTTGVNYAGMAVNLKDPKAPFDATAYDAIGFYARRGPHGVAHVRFGVPDANTDPDAKVCNECFNDFGLDVQLSESWQRYVLPFAAMRQEAGWGSPRPSQIDKARLFSVQFKVLEREAEFDIWVDQLEFLRCQAGRAAPPGW